MAQWDDSENNDPYNGGGSAPAPSGPTYDQVNGDYLKYLGRSASQSEYQNWASHGADYNSSMIANSPEGLAWTNKNVPGTGKYDPSAVVQPGNQTGQAPPQQAATTGPDYGSDSGVLAQIAQWASMPGADPSLKNDPNYWLNAIKSRGGLNAGNLQYWQDASVGPTAFFNNPGREGGGGGSTAPPPTSGGGYVPGQTPGFVPPPNTTPGAGNSAQGDALYNFLMQRAHQSEIVDPNDPLIRSQSDNYSANMTRTGRQYLSELAERKGAGGNIGAESRMVAEKNAQASASHEGDLIQHESDQRKQEIEQALALGSQYMTAQQQMDLQRELATINANMQLYQSKVQQQQFGQSQGQQADQFGRTLANNKDQFGQTMSAREREFNDNLRQRAYEFDTTDEYNRSPYAHPA